jgi:phage tail-like protein
MTDLAVTTPAEPVASPRPRSLSARGLMMGALPPIYHEGARPGGRPPLLERWLSALETVLDPVGALLDCLPAYVDPELAPEDLLELLCAWVGMPLDPVLPVDARRRLLGRAADIADRRGTQPGLELVLELAYPELTFTVVHTGEVTTADGPRATPDAPPPEIEVRCATALAPEQRLGLHGLIEDQRPAHVPCRLVEGAAGTA